MSDIFISYKREDLVLARALAIKLEGLGWAVWWDHDIPAGEDYDQVIERELNVVKCVLVLWSARSVISRNVKDEANVALERKVLIPVLIGNDTRAPLGFRMIQGVRWNDNEQVEKAELEELLRHIKRLIGDPPANKNNPVLQGPDLTGEAAGEISQQKKLAEIYHQNTISADVYMQSLQILNKQEQELSKKEKRLKRNLDAFLSGGLAGETFLDNWEMIMHIPDNIPAPPLPQQPAPNKAPATPVQKNKFCTNCGKVIKPAQLFCTGCGKKVK